MIDDSSWTRVLELLWQVTWQASVLVLVVLSAQVLFRRWLTPGWRYALWGLVVVRLLIPVLPESSFSVFNLVPRTEGDPVVRSEPLVLAVEPLVSGEPPLLVVEAPVVSRSTRVISPSAIVNTVPKMNVVGQSVAPVSQGRQVRLAEPVGDSAVD